MNNYEEPCDFVKYHEAEKNVNKAEFFKKAKEFMQQPSGRNARYSAHIFCNVIDSCQNINKIIELSQNLYKYINLEKTAIEGFYINNKNDREVTLDMADIKKILQNPPNQEDLYFNDYTRAVEIYQEAIHDIVENKNNIIYGMNLAASALRIPTYLADVPNHINPEKNLDINYSLGINVSTFYIGSHHSFTDIHAEDGYLDSANIVHCGITGAWKGWLLIHPDDNAKLNSLLLESIQNLQKNGECQNFKCSTPMNHKNICLSPHFLKTNDIRYQVIVQRPGDLVYVESMVYHQVINFGINLAEAVNVGSSKWNSAANHCIPCICPDNAITAIVRNSQSYEITRAHSASTHRCNIEGCSASFTNKVDLHTHSMYHVNPNAKKLICVICNKSYKSKNSLQKHSLRTHVNQQPICSICNQPQTVQNFQRHIRRCNSKEKECPYCRKSITKPSGLGPHKARCPKKPNT